MEKLGLIFTEKKANAKYYTVNTHHPLYPELKSLILKTVGVGDILRKGIKEFPQISWAFIYGSFATGEVVPSSDLDLFLIGNIPMSPLNKTIAKLERELKREIQYTIFEEKEFLGQLKKGNDFIGQVHSSPKIMLIGEENEYQRFAEKRVD